MFKFNPFTGLLDYGADTLTAAEKVQEAFEVEGSVSVGDVVIPSAVIQDGVRAITSNYNYPSAAIGVVTEVVSPTRCTVLITGKLSGPTYQLSGLTFGKTLFIGSDGKLTTTAPATGPLQKMGFALKSDVVFLLPNLEIINRV